MLVQIPSSAAFLQGMGNVLAISSTGVPVDFSYTVPAGDIGIYWRHVGEYLYHAIDNAAEVLETIEAQQLSLNL